MHIFVENRIAVFIDCFKSKMAKCCLFAQLEDSHMTQDCLQIPHSVKTVFLIIRVLGCLPTGREIDQCCSFKNKKHLALLLMAQSSVSSYSICYKTHSIHLLLLYSCWTAVFCCCFKTVLVQTDSFRHLMIILWFSGFSV